jgi:hypothetical protein
MHLEGDRKEKGRHRKEELVSEKRIKEKRKGNNSVTFFSKL